MFSGWPGIAQKTGFGLISPLPGIWPSLHLDTAITLPVGVETYAAYALRAWLARDQIISDRTRRFAKWPAICSFALGMAGQVACHLMAQAEMAQAPWPVTTLVSCLPSWSWPWEPRWPTCCAPMLRPWMDRTAGPGHGRSAPHGPGRRQPEADRDRSVSRDQTGPKPGPQGGRAVTGGAGPPCRPQARRSGKTSIAASVARRRSHGLQPGPERPGAPD